MDIKRNKWLQSTQLDLFWWFVCERQAIWHGRFVEGKSPPWTNDAVLRTYRFTNVYRELDPGTQYAVREILERDAPKPDKVFNIMLYRLIGRKETHAAIGFQRLDSFNPEHVTDVLHQLRDSGRPPFTSAYIVSSYNNMGSHDKIENVVRLFTILSNDFGAFYSRIEMCRSAQEVFEVLRTADGFGTFLSYQVLVDLLYPLDVYDGRPLLPFSYDDWAVAGPGAKKGIAALLKNRVKLKDMQVMVWLRDNQSSEFERLGLNFQYLKDKNGRSIPISLPNIQNCLCEFHKYAKILKGKGRARRKMVTSRETIKIYQQQRLA